MGTRLTMNVVELHDSMILKWWIFVIMPLPPCVEVANPLVTMWSSLCAASLEATEASVRP